LSPLALNRIYILSATGQEVPLGQLVKSVIRVAPLIINHQGQFPSVTLSFNLKPGVALGQAVNAIARVKQQLHVPASLATSFQGNAQAFTSSPCPRPASAPC
jgi:multidrug efflux pump subunit AcrB